MSTVTELLEAAQRGEPRAAADLIPAVYAELRRLAAAILAAEQPGRTLSATALVHEAYLRLAGEQRFDGRKHFFGAAAEAMRRILVDQARRRNTLKRGGASARERLAPEEIPAPAPPEELLGLSDALDRLAARDPQKAELVKLRYFAGLTADQAAELLGISPSTADRHWTYARAWLKRAMNEEGA